MKEIIVISEGNEISYSKPFADLFRMQIDNNIITSKKGKTVSAELYSKQVYLNSNISSKEFKMIVGSADVDTPQMKLAYSDNGMSCYLGDHFARINVDEAKVIANYDLIFDELEQLEEKYFEVESEYVNKCSLKKSTYIESGGSFFSKKWISERIVQSYIFLAYHFYIYELREFLEES